MLCVLCFSVCVCVPVCVCMCVCVCESVRERERERDLGSACVGGGRAQIRGRKTEPCG